MPGSSYLCNYDSNGKSIGNVYHTNIKEPEKYLDTKDQKVKLWCRYDW